MEITLGFVIVTKVIAGLIAGLLPIIIGVLIGNMKQGRRWFWLCFMLSLIDFIAAFFAGIIFALLMVMDIVHRQRIWTQEEVEGV